jgi:hypothetical protein
MPAPNIISGFGAAIAGIPHVGKWTLATTADIQKYADSSTDGAKVAIPGNEDWTVNIDVNGDVPAVMPKTMTNFAGVGDGTNGASGNIIVDEVSVKVDLAGSKQVAHSIKMSGNGPLTLGTVSAADATTYIAPSSLLAKLLLSPDGTSFTDFYRLLTATLTITAANPKSADAASGGFYVRAPGNLDWKLAATANIGGDLSVYPALNAYTAAKLYTTTTTFWLIKWLQFKELTGIDYDVDNKKIVTASFNWEGSAVAPISGTPTLGSITLPGAGSPWWPGSGS